MLRPGGWHKDRKLTAITVEGFKSALEPVRVQFRDITILAGVNSAGKSAIMQPLLLLKQTIEKPFDPGPLAIDGPLARFTSAEQFFSHARGDDKRREFKVVFEHDSVQVGFTYCKSATTGVDIVAMTFTSGDHTHSWEIGQTLNYRDKTTADLLNAAGLPKEFFDQAPIWPKIRVDRDRAVLMAGFAPDNDDISIPVHAILSPADTVVNELRNLIYLPGLRGNPERHYPISRGGPQYPGSFNDYVASIIHQWGRETKKNKKLHDLGENIKKLGLTSRVTAKAVDDTRVELRVGRLPSSLRGNVRDTVNIADVGFGVSQSLPVLVALLAANPGQMVYIEQPELHLHPRAQAALAEIIIQAADRGVRVVIETHSSLLLLALQCAIAEGKITPARMSMNWFTRDNTGQTHVNEAQLAEDGSYGDWPVDFDNVELDLQNRYMTLVERRHAKG